MKNRVTKYADGKYRWIYDLDMKKNKSILNTTIIVVLIAYCVPLILLMGIFAFEGNLITAAREVLPIYLMVGLVLIVITYFSYMIVGHYYKWTMSFMYEMDEDGVYFKRFGDDKEKSETIGKLSAMVGMMTGNYGLVGGGINLATGGAAYSKFSKVRSIKAIPEQDLIEVNSLFLHNSVYVYQEDYDFVKEYIEEYTGKTA